MSTDKTRKEVDRVIRGAQKASRELAARRPAKINTALRNMAALLAGERKRIATENRKDLAAARKKGLPAAMQDRLHLSDKTFRSMIDGLRTVARLDAPLGSTYDERTRPNGLRIYKVKAPIGVVALIYESRPNVTVDAAAICLKSQNAVVLRGGSEAFYSNRVLARLFSRALADAGLPREAAGFIPTTDRAAVDLLLARDDLIDLVIPRGGESLIRRVVEKARMPVIKHYRGVCHVFVSAHADMRTALPIVVNAKTQRPGVCNAMETLLLDRALADKNKKALLEALIAEGVELRGDKTVRSLMKGIGRATEEDWEAEYLDLRLAVAVVDGVRGAIEHINRYGSHHTDAILSRKAAEIKAFSRDVDSSSVIINASTRFSDGGEYGMGCEIGISTDKLHARGPMGVEDLTTYKWIVEGKGQIRS